jgi:predicted ribosome quality control (RQC) complex YloA/Tae2 family protein
LLLRVEPQRLGLGLSTARPQGLPASAFVRRLRVLTENARLEQIHAFSEPSGQRMAALELLLTRRDQRTRLIADFDSRQPNLLIVDEDGRVLGAANEVARRARFAGTSYSPPAHYAVVIPQTAEQGHAAAKALLEGRAQDEHEGQRKQLRIQARAALKRAERRQNAIAGDVERAGLAPALRQDGNLLLCHLAAVPRGAASIELEDQTGDPPIARLIKLDPSLSAEQNAERKFSQARRLSRGLTIASERLREAQRETAALRALLEALDEGRDEELDELTLQAGIRAPRLSPTPLRKRGEARAVHVPFRQFESSGGARILVGKGAADNDTLTLTVAKPHDLWLHARNLQGAHVIVPATRQAAVLPEVLLDAAHLAAHFSSARGERVVEIQHTERRYVRKPKGSAPGAVRVDRERTLLLRVEPERIKRLLAQERA